MNTEKSKNCSNSASIPVGGPFNLDYQCGSIIMAEFNRRSLIRTQPSPKEPTKTFGILRIWGTPLPPTYGVPCRRVCGDHVHSSVFISH